MKDDKLNIRLARMTELTDQSELHRWELLRYSGGEVHVGLDLKLQRRSRDIVALTVAAHYTTVRSLVRRPLLDLAVESLFTVDGLSEVADFSGGEAVLPAGLLSAMLSVAIGGLRGMIALRTADTFLANYPLPIYDLRTLLPHLTLDLPA
ncbi:MAG: hypothetical protein NC336_07505 [Clostridium sp.]|nr:hypothetical protein [Clostridium sp.]